MKDFFDKIRKELSDKKSNYVLVVDFKGNIPQCKLVKDAFVAIGDGNSKGWVNTTVDFNKLDYLGFKLHPNGQLFMYHNGDVCSATEYLAEGRANELKNYSEFFKPIIKRPKRKLDL